MDQPPHVPAGPRASGLVAVLLATLCLAPFPRASWAESLPNLQAELDAARAKSQSKIPGPAKSVMQQAQDALRHSGILAQALKVGDRFPDFTLPDAAGKPLTLKDLLTQGPAVVSFYRGSWCPYCNLALKALQNALPQIAAQGGQLVAISPEVPDKTLTFQEKAHLTFPVLSDRGNGVARRCGLVFTLPPAVRALYGLAGIDLVAHNGDQRYELPLPATFVVAQDGIVRYAFVDTDYTRRAEPADIVATLLALRYH
jgi:peroxiredoxin